MGKDSSETVQCAVVEQSREALRMYKGERILAVIPARGGSKGIKDKNIYPIKDKPLIAYTIEAGLGSRYVDLVMVSTDSETIASKAKEYGAEVPFMRPDELAGDTSKTIDAIVDVLKRLDAMGEKFDVLVLLQPTSPLRNSGDIDGAIELFYKEDKRSLLSVNKALENPVLYRKLEGNRAVPVLSQNSTVRRQDFETYYRVNGAIYINSIPEISEATSFNDNETAFVMPTERCVDIDSMEDIYKAEKLLT